MENRTKHMTDLHGIEGSVEMGSSTTVQILKVGTLVFISAVNDVTKTVTVKNAYYVPRLTKHLISVSCVQLNGVEVI